MVTAVLADYRGFDTMFETVVVFIAGIAVIAILQGSTKGRGRRKDHEVEAEPDLIVVHTVRLIVPVIQIFAFYVLAHGHVSPGGGFQGGVVMGASFILIALSWDLETAMSTVSNQDVFDCGGCRNISLWGIGLLSMFLGGEFLDYAELERDAAGFPRDGPLSCDARRRNREWVLPSQPSCLHCMRILLQRVDSKRTLIPWEKQA